MKRKILLFFLTIITAVCLCAGFSACGLLEELSGAIQNVEQSSSGVDGSEQDTTDDENSEQDTTDDENSEQDTSGGDGTEQDTPGDDDSEQDKTGDDDSEQDASGGDDSEQGSSGEDGSEQDAQGDDGTEQDASDNEGSEQDTSGDDDSEQDVQGDDGTEQDTSDNEGSEQDAQGDDGTEQDTSGDDGSEQDTSGDDGSGSEEGSGEETAVFTAREGNSTYGYYRLASETNGAEMQSLYYQMYTACETFITDTSDVAMTRGYYTISEIYYGEYSLTADEAVSVWRIFYLENPMYYWLSNSCGYSESACMLYLRIDEYYASYAARELYDAAISAMVMEAGAIAAQAGSELEKALAIHDYIISKADYAYQSDGTTPETAIWAHNITGVSSKGYGVCEAYSKTYLALCLMNGLDCIIVTGSSISSGEDHAWNIVKIDGVWYGVDCTWDDTGDDSDLSYSYFGMDAGTISATRVADSTTYGAYYLYDLPEITACGVQLVTLFKGETELGIYANIDAAFAAMTDSAADYTIELYFCNSAGVKVETSPSTTVYIHSAYTPAVNSVTINGIYTDLGNDTFYVSYLNIESKLTLKCDFEISNIILTAAELDLGEYTLTVSGYYCRLNGSIYDSKTTETISIKSTVTYQTDIYAALDVSYCCGRMVLNGTATMGTYYGSERLDVFGTATIGTYYGAERLVVCGTVTIDKYISANDTSYYNINLQGGAELKINNLVYDSDGGNKIIYILIQFNSIEEYPSLYLGNVEAWTCMFVSGYISASEAADPSNLNCAVAALGSAEGFTNIKIYFESENKTSLYSVNADDEIVYIGT